ncbi:MAG: hypothetical protein ACR2RE_08910 [Geminicoccaceae bacterium]
MPDLADILRTFAERGHLRHISISALSDGRYQVSCKVLNEDAYSVDIREDLILAILKAIGPAYGHSWSEKLGDELGPKVDAMLADWPDDDEELDLMETVL